MNNLATLLIVIAILSIANTVSADLNNYMSYCNDKVRVYVGCQYYGWGNKWGFVGVMNSDSSDMTWTSIQPYTDPAGTLTTNTFYKSITQGPNYSSPQWFYYDNLNRMGFVAEISRGDDGQNLPLLFNLNTHCGSFTVQLSAGFYFCFLYSQCGTCVA